MPDYIALFGSTEHTVCTAMWRTYTQVVTNGLWVCAHTMCMGSEAIAMQWKNKYFISDIHGIL